MISSAQLRAARSLVGLSQSQVAEAAGVSIPTLKRAEGSGVISASEKAVKAICEALDKGRMERVAENYAKLEERAYIPSV